MEATYLDNWIRKMPLHIILDIKLLNKVLDASMQVKRS